MSKRSSTIPSRPGAVWLRCASLGIVSVPLVVLAAPPTGDSAPPAPGATGTTPSVATTHAGLYSSQAIERGAGESGGGVAGFAFVSGFEPPCLLGAFVGGGASSVPQSCEWHGSAGVTVPVPTSPFYSNAEPLSGLQHLRAQFDPVQPQGDPDQVAQPGSRNWAFSDDITPAPPEGPVTVSLWVKVNSGEGPMQNALIIQPQAPSQMLLTTVFRFDPDGTIYAGDDGDPGDGNFNIAQLPFVWPTDEWIELQVAIDDVPGDGGGPSGNCCDDQGPGNPGCDDPICEALVCAKDPVCCDFVWDGTCAGAAIDLCGCAPSPPTNPGRIRYLADGQVLLDTKRPNGGACGGVFAGSIIEHVLVRWEGNLDDGWSVDVDDVSIEPGVPAEDLGACCTPGGCVMMTQFDCRAANGTFAGNDSDCSGGGAVCNGCDVPAGGLSEGEACGADSNGGCNSTPAAFANIGFGQTISGTAWAECATRDTDWYMIPAVAETTTVTATLDSQFTGNVSFFDVTDCANPVGLVASVSGPCSSGTTATVDVEPGQSVAIIVSTFSFWDAPCAPEGTGGNNEYRIGLALGGGPGCLGDTNGDNIVNVDDLVNVILDWGTNGAANGGDVDGSGLVNVDDLVTVILAWGPC